jgi:hypothetical protein
VARNLNLLLLTSFSLVGLIVSGCSQSYITRKTTTLEEIRTMCPHTKDAFGCARTEGANCIIYVPRREEYPAIRERFKMPPAITDNAIEINILGHEAKHCFDGAWH